MGVLRELLTIMLLLYSIPAAADAQSATFDVNFEENTLEQVITFLKEKSNYDFVYRKGMLPADVHVNLKLQNATVEEVLRKSLPQGFSFNVSNNVVVINRAPAQQAASQTPNQKFTVSGTVYETTKDGKRVPLPHVTIIVEGQALHAVTDANGQFTINNVPWGQIVMNVSMLGKIPVNRTLNVDKDTSVEIVMEDDNFRVQDVVVTATPNLVGQSTSSVISRAAIDHLQATSLKDVMTLIPGGLPQNQNLNLQSQINLRTVGTIIPETGGQTTGHTVDLNAMGVSIIQNGAPMSNNTNLQTMTPAVSGGGINLANGASATGGIDSRGISMENVESIEVIRGIASVEYGDVASGVIIINSKAGREPLRINARVNPNLFQVTATGGYNLGERAGALNFSADYADNTKNPIQSYLRYKRFSAGVLYSNTFFNNLLSTNTSLDFTLGLDQRKQNPDDKRYELKSKGEDKLMSFSTNGIFNINKGWLRNIRYVLSASYNMRDSYYQTTHSTANTVYSGSMVDGTVLWNKPGEHLYDSDGNEITNFTDADAANYAYFTPNTYLGYNSIEGREVNLFGKVTANLSKVWARVNNRILLGADIKHEGNEGKGKYFNHKFPPYRNITIPYSSYRPRDYRDIPYITQFGAFAEENLQWNFAGKHMFNLQAGLRFDHISSAGHILAPRFNASIDLIPGMLSLTGGFGVHGKMPTLIYLHPEAAYFEQVNMNTIANESIPEGERMLITTTRVFDTKNKDLEIAKNTKAEIGLRFKYGQYSIGLTAFRERMNNGYTLEMTPGSFHLIEHNKYRYEGGEVVKNDVYNGFARYNMPTNNYVINSDGLELELDLGRFDAIRTAVSLNGAWTKTEHYSKGNVFVNGASTEKTQSNIGIYDSSTEKQYNERIVSALRLTHNIPEIGFVVTLTTHVIWKESEWYKYSNENFPMWYISKEDGLIYPIDQDEIRNYDNLSPDRKAFYSPMMRTISAKNYLKETLPPLLCFNINVTKELSDWGRISFFANNMFRSYPVVRSKRDPERFYKRNQSFFFGMEMSFTIK